MVNIGCSFVVVSLIHPRKRTTLFSLRLEPPSKRWSRLLAPDGILRKILKVPKTSGWTKTRVRSFIGWYRHITLVLLALAYLAGICATARGSISPPATSEFPPRPSALPLTIPEVRHLLARLIWPSSSSARRVLAWSWWRRCHQSTASYYHIKCRRDLLANPGWYLYNPLTVLPTALFPRLPRNFLEVSEFQELRSRVSTLVFS
jgi:hypothetical protein